MRVWCSFDFCAQGTNVNLCNRSITPEKPWNLSLSVGQVLYKQPSIGRPKSSVLRGTKDKYTHRAHTHAHTHTHIRFRRSFFQIAPKSLIRLFFRRDSFVSSHDFRRELLTYIYALHLLLGFLLRACYV